MVDDGGAEMDGAATLARACVVMVRTQGPVNLGMAARLCGNLGVTDLRLVNPECEVNTVDGRRFATRSRDLLLNAPVFTSVAAAVADCGLAIGSSARPRDGDHGPPLRPSDIPALLAQRPAARFALVFGNEADGLTDDELHHCQAFVRLQTFGPNTSYNLSHAIAIVVYQLATSLIPAPPPEHPEAAPRVQAEMLYAYWLRTLERFDYFRRTDQERFAPQLRRLLNRLHLSVHDVQMLWGMLAQMNYFAFGERDFQLGGPASGRPPKNGPPGLPPENPVPD